MTPDEVQHLLESSIAGANVQLSGEGCNLSAIIISDDFAGKSLVKRQQQVYAALGNAFERGLHAFNMKTYTFDEWEQLNG